MIASIENKHIKEMQSTAGYSFELFPLSPQYSYTYIDSHVYFDREWNKPNGILKTLHQHMHLKFNKNYKFKNITSQWVSHKAEFFKV